MKIICLFFLALCASSYDTMYQENLNVEELNCDDYQEICYKCNSSVVYQINDIENFQILGFLEGTVDLIESVLVTLDEYIENELWYLATDTNRFCIEMQEIQEDPLYEDLLQDLLYIDYSSFSVQQFEEQISLVTIKFVAHQGFGTGFFISEAIFDYELSSEQYLADLITLEPTQKRLSFEPKKGKILYSGQAKTSVEEIFCNFSSIITYNTEPSEILITLFTENLYLVGEWFDAAYNSAGCEDIPTPRGLNSLSKLPVTKSDIYASIADLEILVLLNMTADIYAFSFAIAPEVLFEEVSAEITVVSASCNVEFQAIWENTRTFSISLESGEEEEYEMSSELTYDPKTMFLQEYEDLIFTLYIDPIPLFPQFSLDSRLVNRLTQLILYDPYIYTTFVPEISMYLNSTAMLNVYNDTQLSFNSSRIDTVVTNTGIIITNMTYSLFNVSELYLIDIELGKTVFYVGPDYINVTTEIFTYCNSTPFCEIVRSYVPENKLEGSYFPDYFYLSQKLNDFEIGPLLFYNSEFRVYIEKEYQTLIWTKFDLEIDEEESLPFVANLTSVEGSMNFLSLSNGTWKDVFGAKALYFPSLIYSGELDESGVLSSQAKGVCEFLNVLYTWTGILYMSIDLENIEDSAYTCLLKPTSSSQVFKFLADMQTPDEIVENIEFPFGVSLEYALNSYNITASAYFLGALTEITGSTLYIPDILELTLEISNIATGYGNMRGENLIGFYAVEPQISYCEINGTFSLWGIVNNSTLYIEDEMAVNMTGYIFSGIYETNISLSSEISEFSTANWTASYAISDSDIASLNDSITANLDIWIDTGLQTLSTAESAADSYYSEYLDSSEKLCTEPCPTEQTCEPIIELKCTEKTLYYECIDYTAACDVVIFCTESTDYCIDDSCEEIVSICTKYEDQCETGENLDCTMYILEEIGIECLKYSFECIELTIPKLACSSECEYLDLINDQNKKEYEAMLQAYELTIEDLSGFNEISDVVLFEIHSISTLTEVSEVGIGPLDIYLQLELSYYSNGELVTETLTIPWDYYSETNNSNMLTGLIISLIVKSSDTLTDELLYKTPQEIYFENIIF